MIPRPSRLAGLVLLATLAACHRTSPAAPGGRSTASAPAIDAQADHLPPPGPARPFTIPAASEQTLSNGLRVIVVPHQALPLVTLSLRVLAGGAVDPPGQAGLAAFTAMLLNQGTRDHDAPQLAEAANALGGSLDSSADWDSSTVSITVTTPKADAAAALLAEVVREPRFAEAEVERMRAQALDSLRVELAQPRSLATLAAARLAWGDAVYGHALNGTPASLAALRRSDLAALHAAWYRPDDAVLVVTGDLDASAAMALARSHFGDWRAPRQPLPPRPTLPPDTAHGPARVWVIDQPDAGQAAVAAVCRVGLRSAPDYPAGELANAVIGGGYSARLNEEIRIKRGLSYGASSRLIEHRAGGAWLAFAQTRNGSAPDVLKLMRQTLAGLGTGAPDTAELAVRRAALIGRFGRALETTEGLADAFGQRADLGLPLAAIRQEVPAVLAIGPAAVQHYVQTHLVPGQVDFVIVGAARQFLEALRQAVPAVEVIAPDQLDLDRPDLRKPPSARTSG